MSLPVNRAINNYTATVSQVFTDFIHGKDTDVNVVGASAGPSDVGFFKLPLRARDFIMMV